MDRTKLNYLVDLGLLVSGILIMITGVMKLPFLALHKIIRMYWPSQIHDWAGLVFVILVLLHIILHWNWIVCMTKNYLRKK